MATSDQAERFEMNEQFVNQSCETIRLFSGFIALAATRHAARKRIPEIVEIPGGSVENTHIRDGVSDEYQNESNA